MVPRVIRMLIKAFRVNLKKFHETPSLKTEIPILQKECILKIKLRITKINNSIIDIRNITYESIDHISICHILARLECPSKTDWSSNGDHL